MVFDPKKAVIVEEEKSTFDPSRAVEVTPLAKAPPVASQRGLFGTIRPGTSRRAEIELEKPTFKSEFVSPLLSAINEAGFGLAKTIATDEQLEEIFPEQKTLPGKVLRVAGEVAGLGFGGAAKISQKIGMKFFPPLTKSVLGLGRQKVGAIAKRRFAVATNRFLRNALESGVFGALQLDIAGGGIDPTVKGQAKQAGSGAVLGGFLGLLSQKVFRTGKGVRKRIARKARLAKVKRGDLTRAEKLAERSKGISAKQVVELKAKETQTIGKIDDSISKANKQKSDVKFKNAQEFSKHMDDIKAKMDSDVEVLKEAFSSASEKVAVKTHSSLPQMFRNNGRGYKATLQPILDDIVAKGEQFTVQQTDDIMKKVVNDLDDAGILEGLPRERIQELIKKYSIKQIGEPSKFISAKTGQRVGGAIKSNADDLVPFEELLRDLRSVQKTLSSAAQSGTKRFTQEEVAVAILNKNLGGALKDKSKEFAALQESYSKIIEVMKAANRVFKPNKGVYDLGSTVSFLEKFGMGKTRGFEDDLIKAIEQGNEFAPGIGQLTASLKDLGRQLKASRDRIQPILRAVRREHAVSQRGVDEVFLQRVQKLERNKEFIQSNFAQKEQKLTGLLQKRLKELGFREQAISELSRNPKQVRKFMKKLSGTVLNTAERTAILKLFRGGI